MVRLGFFSFGILASLLVLIIVHVCFFVRPPSGLWLVARHNTLSMHGPITTGRDTVTPHDAGIPWPVLWIGWFPANPISGCRSALYAEYLLFPCGLLIKPDRPMCAKGPPPSWLEFGAITAPRTTLRLVTYLASGPCLAAGRPVSFLPTYQHTSLRI